MQRCIIIELKFNTFIREVYSTNNLQQSGSHLFAFKCKIIQQTAFRLCVKQLREEGFNTNADAGPPENKDQRVFIIKKMCNSSLSSAANAYIKRLEINYSALYTMLTTGEDENDRSAIHNEVYDRGNDLDVLQDLIEEHVESLSNEQLGSIGNFGLSARTFCNEANTIGGPNYISDLFTEEELSASSSNDNDYEHLNFENENYSFLDNIL
ncbi:uncharacterized protein LOC114123119 isoform X2 [Aphis gossypii]|uniref:uncharacterized protein LOC114123119 isoform X2 n=1 Tax=Aphis gossypii TaxID=80765 RepID=UPI002158B067|nr:uncharacterized protein LOC114123119 isoform X2 [Aphis gossypii]